MLKFVLFAREMETHKRIVLVFDNEEDLLLYIKNCGLSIIIDEAYQRIFDPTRRIGSPNMI